MPSLMARISVSLNSVFMAEHQLIIPAEEKKSFPQGRI